MASLRIQYTADDKSCRMLRVNHPTKPSHEPAASGAGRASVVAMAEAKADAVEAVSILAMDQRDEGELCLWHELAREVLSFQLDQPELTEEEQNVSICWPQSC